MNSEKRVSIKIFPVLPVKDAVLFPSMVIPIIVKTEKYLLMIEEVHEKDKRIVIAMLNDGEKKTVSKADSFARVGTLASILKLTKGEEGTVAVVQGISRVSVVAPFSE